MGLLVEARLNPVCHISMGWGYEDNLISGLKYTSQGLFLIYYQSVPFIISKISISLPEECKKVIHNKGHQ